MLTDIILFPKNVTSNEYEYIDPKDIVRRLPVRKESRRDTTSRNTYTHCISSSMYKKKSGKEITRSDTPEESTVSNKQAVQGKAITRRQVSTPDQTVTSSQASIRRQISEQHQTVSSGQASIRRQVSESHQTVRSSQATFAAIGTEAARKALKHVSLNPEKTLTCQAQTEYTSLHHTSAYRDVKDMNVDEISDWMTRMMMSQYVEVIVSNGVDGALLQSLDEDILTREFGMTRFHAIKLLKFANDGYRPT